MNKLFHFMFYVTIPGTFFTIWCLVYFIKMLGLFFLYYRNAEYIYAEYKNIMFCFISSNLFRIGYEFDVCISKVKKLYVYKVKTHFYSVIDKFLNRERRLLKVHDLFYFHNTSKFMTNNNVHIYY